MSLPPEILKKVKLLELSTRKLVNNLFAGEYHSAFRGQGMTFSEFREYTPGDDVRSISWPVTARMGKPFIKKFEEERELTLMLVVDVSGSGDFGSNEYLKGEIIAHLAAVVSFSAVKNNDPVGLLLVSDQVEHFVPPKKGRGHVYRILRDIYYMKPKSSGTKLSAAFEYLQGMLKKRSTIFVFSDFMDQAYDRAIRQLSRKHDVIACVVEDPVEQQLPDIGLVDLHDAETGTIVTVDSSSSEVQKLYRAQYQKQKANRDQLLRRAQVDKVDVVSGPDFIDSLVQFFHRRGAK